jgi:hypothetical protein
MADATTTAIVAAIIVVFVVQGIIACWQCGTALITCCAVCNPCGLFGIPCPATGCFGYDSVKVGCVRMSDPDALEWSEAGSVSPTTAAGLCARGPSPILPINHTAHQPYC